MIIKLIPIKSKARLKNALEYITTDKGRIEDYKNQGIFHNLKNTQIRHIQHEIEVNYDSYAQKRLNGNIAMHVIISMNPIDQPHLSTDRMDDIVRTFLEKAYPEALALSVHHKSQQHWHSHMVVSANNLMEKKSTRLSKDKLYEVHKYMLDYVKKFPELSETIDLSTWGRKKNNENEYYMKKRNPNLKLSKEELEEKVQDIFRQCESSKQFYERLEKEGYATYTYKDHIQGIHFGEDDKKMRFSRLGIDHEQLAELDKQYERLQELEQLSSHEKKVTVDQYIYDMEDKRGNSDGINPDLETEQEYDIRNDEYGAEIPDYVLDAEFEHIMGLPVDEDNKDQEVDSDDSSNLYSGDEDVDKEADEIDAQELEADEADRDLDDDLDQDNDMDMDTDV